MAATAGNLHGRQSQGSRGGILPVVHGHGLIAIRTCSEIQGVCILYLAKVVVVIELHDLTHVRDASVFAQGAMSSDPRDTWLLTFAMFFNGQR